MFIQEDIKNSFNACIYMPEHRFSTKRKTILLRTRIRHASALQLVKLRVTTFCQCQTGVKELLKCTYNCETEVELQSQITIDCNYLYFNCGYYPKETKGNRLELISHFKSRREGKGEVYHIT